MDLTCSGEEGPVDFRQAVSVGNGSGVCVWGGVRGSYVPASFLIEKCELCEGAAVVGALGSWP